MRSVWQLLLILAALAVAGCTVENTDSSEGTPPPGDAFVEVLLGDSSIEMPSTAPAGTISFEASNVGEVVHGLAIEGSGVSEELGEIAPTETDVLTVELESGATYTVFCPLDGHREDGEEATIEIGEPVGSEGAPVQEGVEPGEQEDDDPDDEG